ncbi:MAG: ferredoxin family protein [Promethearchaeota archaeon]
MEHIINPERCIECGACELNCRGEAILFDPFSGCGCIWNATFRRLKGVTFLAQISIRFNWLLTRL